VPLCDDSENWKEESTSFFEKKEAKKLSLNAGRGRGSANARRTESFLLLFFKKEALFLAFLTFGLFLALTIGAQLFSWRALAFLVAMNLASMAVGRALLRLEIPAFRLFADYVFGLCVLSLVMFAVCRLFFVSAGVGAAVAAIFALACSARWRRSAGGGADLLLALVVCLASFIWSWQAILAVPRLYATGRFDAWTDYFIHAGEVAQFARFGALHGTSIFAAGAALPLYHYGSYMASAALCAVSGLPALVVVTVFWTLLGFLLLGLAVAVLGEVVAEGAGVFAVIAVLLVPDAAHYGVEAPFFDFHWLMQVAVSSCYAVALSCLAVAAMSLWLRGRRASHLVWAVGLTAAVFEFRVHVFLVLALTNALMFLFAWRPARWWHRPALVLAGLAAALGAMALLETLQRAPHFFSGGHHPVREMVEMLAMPPSPIQDFYGNLIAQVRPAGAALRVLWTGAAVLIGLLLVSAAAFGLLLPCYLAGLVWQARRGRLTAEAFFPLASVAAYWLMIVLFPDTPAEPLEFAHRPFVLPYTMLAVWCGRYALAALQAGLRDNLAGRVGLALSVLLLAVPLSLQGSAQRSGMTTAYLFCDWPVPRGLLTAAAYMRAHAAPGDVVAMPAGPLDDAFLGLSERAQLSPGSDFLTIQSGISDAQAALQAQELALALASDAAASRLGVKWIVMPADGWAVRPVGSHS